MPSQGGAGQSAPPALGAVETPDVSSSLDLVAVIDRLPSLAGAPRTVERLTGGLTNRNFKVTTSERSAVVRISTMDSDLLAIDRAAEHRNSLAAAAAGAAPAVLDYLPGEGVMVVAWVPGRTLTPGDLREATVLTEVAAACRRLHAGPRFVNDFDMFATQRAYLEVVTSHGFRLPARYLDFGPQVERISAALDVRRERTVPCNNDLLPANIVAEDSGRVWLIDYEYSGNNDPCFELGNIWSEADLSPDHLEWLVTDYYGSARRHQIARARLLGLMSKYGWTLWAAISAATCTLEFDFWAWGMEKYERAVAEFDGPHLERLLAEATAAD